MIGFLIVVHTIVSILLVSLVLMQASQGGGLSGTFGGQAASSILGGQGAGNVLSKITGWLAAIFIGLAILISIMSGPNEDSSSSLVKKAAEENPIPVEQNSPQLEEKQPVLDLE
ncbi:preprotein translocase subunit SecG [bacterium]|jgi:preprotein translocase subunit SecG|nr:preprotein translocase subunit SecG [bacterium]MBT4250513.1 preprotein translocase subunit SecG [bacterium]MBT4927442.1 preprotein translocase subunit SecG [bacterium]MBT5733669.1 preprotein translocase subunit SecG [bacterium]MBT6019183.1 preprotein translocase subunit SecG [bacterium]